MGQLDSGRHYNTSKRPYVLVNTQGLTSQGMGVFCVCANYRLDGSSVLMKWTTNTFCRFVNFLKRLECWNNDTLKVPENKGKCVCVCVYVCKFRITRECDCVMLTNKMHFLFYCFNWILLVSFTNLMHNSFIISQYVCYITIPDMFGALKCPSSGGQLVLSQHLVSSLSVNGCTVCRMRADSIWKERKERNTSTVFWCFSDRAS